MNMAILYFQGAYVCGKYRYRAESAEQVVGVARRIPNNRTSDTWMPVWDS